MAWITVVRCPGLVNLLWFFKDEIENWDIVSSVCTHKVPARPSGFAVLLLPPASPMAVTVIIPQAQPLWSLDAQKVEGSWQIGAGSSEGFTLQMAPAAPQAPAPRARMWGVCCNVTFLLSHPLLPAQGRTQPQCCFSCFPAAQPCCGSLAQPINASGKEEYASLQHINSKRCLVEDFFFPQATWRCIYLLGKQWSIKWQNAATGKDCCP